MSRDNQDYNLQEVAETLQQVNQYNAEDLHNPEEQELAQNIVGPINAFYKAAENLDQQTDLYLEDNHDENNLQQAVTETGVAFPDAYQAHQTLQNYAEDGDIGDKLMAAAIKNEGLEQVSEAVNDLNQFDTNYQEAYANMMAASHTLGPDQKQTPIDVAKRLTEEPETQEKLDQMEEEIPRSKEEAHQQLTQVIEDI